MDKDNLTNEIDENTVYEITLQFGENITISGDDYGPIVTGFIDGKFLKESIKSIEKVG
jgi:hypothetical protein